MKKLLIICGPTATGKTDLGILLSKKLDGEIVSADSRQVYKGMDIISGKDISDNSKLVNQNSKLKIKNYILDVGFRLKDGIPIWLVDIVEPNYLFNVGEYSLFARKVITDIWSRKKLPVVVGGSGLYIKSIIEPLESMIIPPNKILRKSLDGLAVDILQKKLIKVDGDRFEKMNESDRANPRRLIRAIEIFYWRKNNSSKIDPQHFAVDSILLIGLKATNKILFERIDKRVEKRIKEGVLSEVKNLIDKKYSSYLNSLSATGFESLSEFIYGKENLTDAVRTWKSREKEYAKRQMVWFNKDKRIIWFDIAKKDYLGGIEDIIRKWYNANC